MCWMPGPYKSKYAYFDCRKVFRSERFRAEMRDIPCPQCGAFMTNMGIHFKTPRQKDIAQWAKVRVLAAHNIRYFQSSCCGWYGPGHRPATLDEVPAYLAAVTCAPESEAVLRLYKLTSRRRSGMQKRR
jgi:hypothetical protein